MSERALKRAIALIRAGSTEAAKPILTEILRLDPDHEQAWLWISKCFPEAERKKYCFERVLKANPENPIARKALAALEQAGKPSVETVAPKQDEQKVQAEAPQNRRPAQKESQQWTPPLSAKAQQRQQRLRGLLSLLLSMLMVVVIAAAVWVGLNSLLPRQIPITHAELKAHLIQMNVFCKAVTATERAMQYGYVMRCSGYADGGSVRMEVDAYSERDPQKIDLILVYATQESGQPEAGGMGEALAYVAALPYRNASPEQAAEWVRANFPLLLGAPLEEYPMMQFGRVRYHLSSLTAERKYLAIGEGSR